MVQAKDKARVIIPCWLCSHMVEVKFSRKDKPYMICNNCGIQTFIRYGQAEELLLAKVKEYQNRS